MLQGALSCPACGETTEKLKEQGIDLYWGKKAPVIGSSIVVKQLTIALGIGFLFGLVLIGAIREFFRSGALLGHDILGFKPLLVMILPAGGFFLIGFIIAAMNWIEYKATGKMPKAGGAH